MTESFSSQPVRIDHTAIGLLITALRDDGYTVVGPTIDQGAIVYGEIASAAQLPQGTGDEQDGGSYRLRDRGDSAYFGYAVGPQAWKRFLFPSTLRLWTAAQNNEGFTVGEEPAESPRYAFLGVRACELQAILVQDRTLAAGSYQDSHYTGVRDQALIIAVNCGSPAGTCFCASMGTGPAVGTGHDLLLTEVMASDGAYFLAEAGSSRGAELVHRLPSQPATAADMEAAAAVTQQASERMGRRMDVTGIKELLYGNLDHPRWDEVAQRCLTCANCTMVCPTCFCTSVEDTSDLTGHHAERWRYWDSCFTLDHSYIHGGNVRASAKSRYRQWLTHKLASWIDQFGTSGCVGCGRCITWCPVGIDITEEVAAIRADDGRTEALR